MSDPFQDDPLPPKPTAQPATEVRRSPGRPTRPVATPARAATTAAPTASPYKIVGAPANAKSRTSNRPVSTSADAAVPYIRKSNSQSVLRRASVEQDSTEPAALKVDHSRATPIIRSQSPEPVAEYEVPANPLRR